MEIFSVFSKNIGNNGLENVYKYSNDFPPVKDIVINNKIDPSKKAKNTQYTHLSS